MGHLNGILALVEGNLNNNFQKSQMPGGGGGMLKLRFDRYIKKNSKAALSFTHLSRDCDFIKSFVTQWTLFFVRVIKSDSYSCFGYTSLPTLVNELL